MTSGLRAANCSKGGLILVHGRHLQFGGNGDVAHQAEGVREHGFGADLALLRRVQLQVSGHVGQLEACVGAARTSQYKTWSDRLRDTRTPALEVNASIVDSALQNLQREACFCGVTDLPTLCLNVDVVRKKRAHDILYYLLNTTRCDGDFKDEWHDHSLIKDDPPAIDF